MQDNVGEEDENSISRQFIEWVINCLELTAKFNVLPFVKAGFHMIADDRGSQKVLRSSAIICDRLRSCDHMETKVLRSAIEMYPIIFLILTDDSTLLSHKARMFDYSNAHLL